MLHTIFFSSRRRHTRCALVTGVQTCALPISVKLSHLMAASYPDMRSLGEARFQFLSTGRLPEDEFGDEGSPKRRDVFLTAVAMHRIQIGRASCRERVCQYV